MTDWVAKRFWTETTVEVQDKGFEVLLDGRPVKTPLKAPLTLPTREMAEAIAGEWQAQGEKIDPETMPTTRSANAAIDKTTPQRFEVAEMLAAYGDSDLLCYRADSPDSLVARQAETWDPLLDWAEATYGARLEPRTGVMHVPQNADALSRLSQEVHGLDPFRLTGFHDLVALSGSLIIGLAAASGEHDLETLWQASRLDESWQEEQWGPDEEATALAEVKRQAFYHAQRFARMCG